MNSHNFCLVFTHKQIAASLRATILTTLILCIATIIDQEQLYFNILIALSLNLFISDQQAHLEGH